VLLARNRTEETLKPILEKILKPVGLIKKDSENPELTTQAPALTTPVK